MNQPSPGFVPSPMIIMQQAPSQGESQIPARVRAAMSFLQDLTLKTMEKVAANDVGFESIEGQKLTLAEEAAQSAACNLLRLYFAGQLKTDRWERSLLKRGPNYPKGANGTLINCIQCHGHYPTPRPDCIFCHGTGSLLVFPTTTSADSRS